MTSSPSYSHTLSLHDALPISFAGSCDRYGRKIRDETRSWRVNQVSRIIGMSRRRASEGHLGLGRQLVEMVMRSEEHTSELQSRGHLVCRLLLEKKKDQT